MRQKFTLNTLILFITLSVGTAAFAEDPVSIGEIEVQGASEYESAQAPSSFTSVIKPDQIPDKSKTLPEILSESVGVVVTETGGPGQFTTVSIRGSTEEQVAVYLDGVLLNQASSDAVDFSTIPLTDIERIEVIRGGGTAQFGPSAIGGVINIITKKARLGRNVDGSFSGGSFSTYKTTESWRERFKNWGFVASHSHMQSMGDYSFISAGTTLSGSPAPVGGGQEFTRIHNAFVSETVLTKFDVDISDDIRFNVMNNFVFMYRDVPGTEEETTVLYPANPLEAKEKIFRTVTSVSTRFSDAFTRGLGVEVALNNNFSSDQFRDPSPAIGGQINTHTYNDTIAPYLKADYSWDNRVLPQTLTLRYDYQRDILKDTQIGHKSRNIHSVVFQDEIHAFSDHLTMIPVVRYAYATGFPNDVSLKLGAAGKPVKWMTIKGNVETSYRFPNFDELYYPDQGYMRGNPNLEKEKALNVDGGFIVAFPFMSVEATYFRNKISNQIIWVPISATTIAPINTYDVNIQGLEAALSVTPVKYVRFNANYTFTKAHFASNNYQLPGRPEHKFNAKLQLMKDWSDNLGTSIFGSFQYESRLAVNAQNTVFIAPRTVVDLGATLKFLKHAEATFEVRDVTNAQVYDAQGFPLPRRSYYLTVGGNWSKT